MLTGLCRSSDIPGASQGPGFPPPPERKAGMPRARHSVSDCSVQEGLAPRCRVASRENGARRIRPLDTQHPEQHPHGRRSVRVCRRKSRRKSLLHCNRQSYRYVPRGPFWTWASICPLSFFSVCPFPFLSPPIPLFLYTLPLFPHLPSPFLFPSPKPALLDWEFSSLSNWHYIVLTAAGSSTRMKTYDKISQNELTTLAKLGGVPHGPEKW